MGKSTEQVEMVQVALHCHFPHIWWAFATNSQKWTRLWLPLVHGVSLTWYLLKPCKGAKVRTKHVLSLVAIWHAFDFWRLIHIAGWTELRTYYIHGKHESALTPFLHGRSKENLKMAVQVQQQKKKSSMKCQMPLFSNHCLVILITSLGAYPLQPEGVAFSLESFTRADHWIAELYGLRCHWKIWLGSFNKYNRKVSLFTTWSCWQVALINPLQLYLPWRITRWKNTVKPAVVMQNFAGVRTMLVWLWRSFAHLKKGKKGRDPWRIFSRANPALA